MLNRQPAGATIAAVATGSGGGVGIIRVSGPDAATIGQKVCRPWPESALSHHLYFGQALAPVAADSEQPPEVIDQVLFCLMRTPRSYTGEDVLEIHGHGGPVNLQRLLEACYQAGATAAQPGEFTRRAFLAGKLDLTGAEAVAALVGAQSVHAARQAQRHLAGELGKRVIELRREAVALLGELEGILDFPDAEADTEIFNQVGRKLTALITHVEQLQTSFTHGGRALNSGLQVAILGRPNVGKSSLINALCGSERVLVDDQPGTTRDFVEINLRWGGVPVTLIDTAGERTTDANRLELQGMRLGRERWRNADLCLLVVDGTAGLGVQEEQLVASIPPETSCLVVWNKTDQTACLPPPADAVACSALCGWGLAEVQQAALHKVAPRLAQGEGELLVTSARQAMVLQSAAAALGNASQALSQDAAPELIAGELRVAAARLGELTGDEVTTQVLDEIFARFCVGK